MSNAYITIDNNMLSITYRSGIVDAYTIKNNDLAHAAKELADNIRGHSKTVEIIKPQRQKKYIHYALEFAIIFAGHNPIFVSSPSF